MTRVRWTVVALATVTSAAIGLAIVRSGETGHRRIGTDVSYESRSSRFAVEIPAGWTRARKIVIPEVTNPREIFVASTFPLRSLGATCGPFYDHVLGHMGRREGFAAVQERFGHEVAGPPEFPRRPARFRLPLRAPERGGCGLNPDRNLVRVWWIPFRDANRDFYADVGIGLAAPAGVRRDALRLLNSLRFKRRRPVTLAVAQASMGVSCPQPSSIRCDRVGLAVWLPRASTRVEASIAGRPVRMRRGRDWNDARFGKRRYRRVAFYEGFLRPAGLLDGPLRVRPDGGRYHWTGRHPVTARVRLTAHYRRGGPARRTLRVPLWAGWG